MFKTYLYADGKKFYRGTYKTPATAIRYGQKDYNNYNNVLFCLGKQNKPHKMVIEDATGEEIYRFSYTYK